MRDVRMQLRNVKCQMYEYKCGMNYVKSRTDSIGTALYICRYKLSLDNQLLCADGTLAVHYFYMINAIGER